jgi:hypothetical protein
MPGTRRGEISVFVLSLLAIAFCGCDEKMPMWTGLGTPPTKLPGVESPAERQQHLQELAQKAPSTPDPAQRETICRDLAQQIRKEPDSILRGEILRTLAAYGGPTATAVLHVAVKDTDADVRKLVCDLWGHRPDAEAAQVLSDVLASDSDKDVRMAAARALGKCHDSKTVQALGPILNDPDPAMQHCAVVSLQSSTGKDLGTDVNRWRQYLKTGEDHDERSWAQKFFGWYR